MGGNFFIKV